MLERFDSECSASTPSLPDCKTLRRGPSQVNST